MADPYEAFSTRVDDPYASFSDPAGKSKQNKPANPYAAGPEALLSVGSSLIASPISGLAGIGASLSNAFGFTDTPAADVVENVGSALTYQPRTDEGRAATSALTYPFRKLVEGADVAGDIVSRTPMLPNPYIKNQGAIGGAGPVAATFTNILTQAAPAALAGGITRGASNLGRGMGAGKGKAAPAPVSGARKPGLGDVPPTIEELGKQATAAYKRASDAGVSITPRSFNNLKIRIESALAKDGIDPTLHPQTTAAFKRISETEGAITLDQLETLRKIANDARGAGKADGRLAGKVVDEIDDYMDKIGSNDITIGDPSGFSALKEARSLYTRKAKAEEISRLIRRAEISAPNFSASGFENALRTEFRALAKNDKKMRRFTKEERMVIERVAKGGKLENALRMVGKFAPTGVISGGVAGLFTGMTGGIGAVVPIAGAAGRYGATRMTRANARRAEETMRRGQTIKEKSKAAQKELVEEPR